jgi:hypothetical protein
MANKTIKLPSGKEVNWRDIADLKQKDRSRIIRGADGTDDISRGMSIIEQVIAVMVESWTLDLLPPSVRIDSLGELSLPDYDTLQVEAQEVLTQLFNNFTDKGSDSPLPNSKD